MNAKMYSIISFTCLKNVLDVLDQRNRVKIWAFDIYNYTQIDGMLITCRNSVSFHFNSLEIDAVLWHCFRLTSNATASAIRNVHPLGT